MPEMSEKRHDPVGGNGNCSAQKLEHLREKSEQELLDELTQTMKWSDQEDDLDYRCLPEGAGGKGPNAGAKETRRSIGCLQSQARAAPEESFQKTYTWQDNAYTPPKQQSQNFSWFGCRSTRSCFKLYGDRICKRDRHFQKHRTLDKGCFPFQPCSIHRNTVFTNFCNIRYFV